MRPRCSTLLLVLFVWAGAVRGDDQRLNLNSATAAQLIALGLSESQALQVVGHREKSGPFLQVEELMAVPQITKDAFNKIHEHVTVNE